MTYQREILLVLKEADPVKGLAIDTIARHVYNMTALDLFNPRNIDDVKADVTKYLRSESLFRGGAVKKTEKRGWYSINPNSQTVMQLMLEFESEVDGPKLFEESDLL